MYNANAVNRRLAELFANGKGEVGLEIGVDPGLPAEEYIRIPRRMKKNWAALVDVDQWNMNHPNAIIEKPTARGLTPAEYLTHPGWYGVGHLRVYKGKSEIRIKVGEVIDWIAVKSFKADLPDGDDLRAFFTVNQGHVRDNDFDSRTLIWVHAVRYWSVVAGFVTASKSAEYEIVDDPDHFATGSDEFAAFASTYHANAWTACAARVTSWRRSNHATGGDVAVGFPRRWLVKEGYWTESTEKHVRAAAEKKATSAFYIATHATAVHAVLAAMVPSDESHWAIIDPSYGYIAKWDVGASAQVRMAPKTQVAGTALVVDSLVVAKMLNSEGLAPLLTHIGQLGALKAAEDLVELEGIRCAVYARWFLDGHPRSMKPIQFSQREATFVELAAELAIIAVKYYPTSSIAQSSALINLAKQSNNESAKSIWARLGAHKKEISDDKMSDLVDMIKGGSVMPSVEKIYSSDPVVVAQGVAAYNERCDAIAAILGVSPGAHIQHPTTTQM